MTYRYKFVIFMFTIFWGILFVKIYDISINSNEHYKKLAKENIERKEFIKPVRGNISDANGNLLAMNRIGFSISVSPHLSTKNGELDNIFDYLIDLFPDLNKTVMIKVYKKYNSYYNHQHIKVVDFISYSDMMGFYPTLSLTKNIKIDSETKRYYPYGRYSAHIIGYTGRSNKKENKQDIVVNEIGKVGKTGLEKYYNHILEGDLGYKLSKVTATNKAVELIKEEAPKDNKNISLNIDIDLQQMIYRRFRNQTGVAIVMKPNGEVLSAVSYPSYDPNLFVGGISFKDWKTLQNNLAHPFTNKFIHGTYPPGSVIKMSMALAFSKVSNKVINKSERCNGYIKLGKHDHKFRCWSRLGHKKVELREAIRESCDVYFYNKSLKVGINAISKNLNTFGFGVKTGIDLPREYHGLIPNKKWKKRRYNKPWYMGETVIASIGQGYDLVTPMQVARNTALIATSYLPTPFIAKEVNGKKISPNLKYIDFNKTILSTIRKGMYDVCNHHKGTGFKTMRKLPIIVAGKTGTSQVASIPQSTKIRLKEEELEYYKRSHAWITTYAPYKNPQYIVTVLVEHGGHGGSTAGPIARDIYKWLYRKGYFKKEKIKDKNSK